MSHHSLLSLCHNSVKQAYGIQEGLDAGAAIRREGLGKDRILWFDYGRPRILRARDKNTGECRGPAEGATPSEQEGIEST